MKLKSTLKALATALPPILARPLRSSIAAALILHFTLYTLHSLAGEPCHWVRKPNQPEPFQFDTYHGETIDFRCTFVGFSSLPFAGRGDSSPRLYYQTNGMAAAWWDIPATVSTTVVTNCPQQTANYQLPTTNYQLSATFLPSADPGAERLTVFFGAPSNAYAAAQVRFRNSPGAHPNDLDPPSVLDWQAELSAATNALAVSLSSQMSQSATNYTDLATNTLAKSLAPTISNTVTKAYVEDLGIESGISAETATNIAFSVSSDATNTLAKSLAPTITNIASTVSSSAIASATNSLASTNYVDNALTNRPTKAQVDEGWWSEWEIVDAIEPGRIRIVWADEDGIHGWVPQIKDDGEWSAFVGDAKGDSNSTDLTWIDGVDAEIDVTATRHRVAAPVPTKPSDIGAQPAGNYATSAQGEKADAALSRAEAEAGFTEWVVTPPTYEGRKVVPVWRGTGYDYWDLVKEGTDNAITFPDIYSGPDATELRFPDTPAFTATRTRLPTMADLSGKASTNDVQLTPVYSQTPTFSEWTFTGLPSGSVVTYFAPDDPGSEDTAWYLTATPEIEAYLYGEGGQYATSLIDHNTGITATRTRTDIIGYTLGAQSDKPLASTNYVTTATNALLLSACSYTDTATNTLANTNYVAKSISDYRAESWSDRLWEVSLSNTLDATTAVYLGRIISLDAGVIMMSGVLVDVGGAGASGWENYLRYYVCTLTMEAMSQNITNGLNVSGIMADIYFADAWSYFNSGGPELTSDVLGGFDVACFSDRIDWFALSAKGKKKNVQNRAFVWNGNTNTAYSANGKGTFNLNPENGLFGVFVGDKNLYELIADSLSRTNSTAINYSFIADDEETEETREYQPLPIMRQSDLAPLQNSVNAMWATMYGESVWMAVTNYMRQIAGTVPSLRLWEVRDSNTNLVYSSAEEIEHVVTQKVHTAETNLLARMPRTAWGSYQSSGEDNPSSNAVTVVNSEKVMLTGGGRWHKVIDTGGRSIWVLKFSGLQTVGGDANGFFRVCDAEGNSQLEVVKTADKIVSAIPSDTTFVDGDFTVTFNAGGSTHPIASCALDLGDDFETEDGSGNINSLGVSVKWNKNSDNLWVATIHQDNPATQFFVYAKATLQGENLVRNNAPTSLEGGIYINNVKYRLVPYTTGGKTYLTLEAY